MRAIFAVYKREVGVFFRSSIAYGIAFGLLLLLGLLFSADVSSATDFNFQQAQSGAGGQIVAADLLVTRHLNIFTVLLFIFAPLLTMRLLSEEAREGTLEVLMTLPMSESAFIIGKFLAAWTYYTIVLLLTLIHMVLLSTVSQPDNGLLLASYGGAWLYGGAVLALSLIWSAVSEDQIVAAFLGAATILVLYLAELAIVWASGQNLTSGLVEFIRELSLQAHYQQTMLQGIVRAQDVLYFVLVIIGALFIATRIVETRRWRAA